MQEHIILREFQKQDAAVLSNIIRKTWSYDKFCSPKTAEKLGRLYLYSCLANQTFTQVAVMDGKPAGIIMGKNIKAHRTPLYCRVKQFLLSVSLLLTKEGRRICGFYKNVSGIDDTLLKESQKDYQGEVAFFALDSRCRGKGIGQRLFNSFMEYMRSENLHNFFLYTDTSCNYGFYEHQGMTRRCQKKCSLDMQGQKADITFFLYDYSC